MLNPYQKNWKAIYAPMLHLNGNTMLRYVHRLFELLTIPSRQCMGIQTYGVFFEKSLREARDRV